MTKIRVIGSAKGCMAPGEPPEKGEYVFTADENCRDYDWLLVYDEFPRRSTSGEVDGGKFFLSCPRERTILATGEPTSVKFYNSVYTRQFGHLLTNRPYEAEKHPHYHFGRGYYLWFVGRDFPDARSFVAPNKTKIISAVYSSKNMRHTLHHARNELLDYLVKNVKGLDRFGKGVKDIVYKYEALDEYKYHISVENHIGAGHWSEKIADPLLCECLPFYAGDPTLAEILPKESFIPIPINDPERAAQIINSAIENNEYEKRLPFIRQARRLIQEKYNFREQIIELIEANKELSKIPFDPSKKEFLVTRKHTRLTFKGAASDAFHHVVRFFHSM